MNAPKAIKALKGVEDTLFQVLESPVMREKVDDQIVIAGEAVQKAIRLLKKEK